MEIKLIFISIILANVLQAQTVNYLNDDYYWVDTNKICFAKMKFERDGKFELIEYNNYDCSDTYSIYGRGKYQIIKDSILFTFDSIPNLKSECKLDSINNDDEYSNLNIIVVDQNGEKIKNAQLSWGKPKRKGRWVTAQFFKEIFDEKIELKFINYEKVYFVRIEKDGYYWGEIAIPEHPNKDYKVEVVLRPSPKVKSKHYISNTKNKLAILSDCEIQYYAGRILKK